MKQTAEHLSYEASVYHTVRGALGPRIRYVACGGAPLDVSLAHFFNGIGLPMIQGYGMTETAAPMIVQFTKSLECRICNPGRQLKLEEVI